MSRLIGVSLVIVLAGVAPSVIGQDQRPRIRFQSMDTDGDGRITRAEWRGSERSFRIHDWNGDGVLSGYELRLDGRRQAAWDDVDFDSADREYDFTDWTPRGFANLDHNRDGRITRDEWHFNRESFRRADHNHDGVISRAEFLNEDSPSGWQDDDRDDRFAFLDVNRDGRISRDEWHGTEER